MVVLPKVEVPLTVRRVAVVVANVEVPVTPRVPPTVWLPVTEEVPTVRLEILANVANKSLSTASRSGVSD